MVRVGCPWRIAIFRLLSAVILASCAQFKQLAAPKLEKPTVELVGLKLGRFSFTEQKFNVRLKAANPNDVDIPVAFIHFTLVVQDTRLANGSVDEPFILPAKGSAEFEVALSTSLLKMAGQISRLLKARQEKVDYRISGQLGVDIPFVGPFPFEKIGTINLKR